jgi:hypothetical protein
LCFDSEARFGVAAGLRRTIELAIGEEDLVALHAIARSRTESVSRVERARMLLGLPKRPLVLCGGSSFGGAPSDG